MTTPRPAVTAAALLLSAVVSCATNPPVTAPGLALRKVVIYRNGVGYFERGGHVDTDRVQFQVRKDEVGDFLATLAVLERGGSSVRSASFPLEVQNDNGDEGETPSQPPPQPMSPTGFAPMPRPTPPPPRPPVDKGIRRVTMALDGKEHDLQVGYIAQTPVWRPSYRLVIDKQAASLQTWGIVQNLSGEDWTNVSLSLVAEAPLAFDASLATAVIPPRPVVTDGGDVIAVVPRSETSLSQEPPPPPPAAAPMAAPAPSMKADSFAGRPGAKKGKSAERRMSGAESEAADSLLEGRVGGGARPAACSSADRSRSSPRARSRVRA